MTCNGTPTGASLSFDAQGQLSAWQNTPNSPTSTDGFLYDNQGNRVEQVSTQAGATTTTVYVGNLEQVATSGSTTTTTTYYYANGQRIALAVNGVFSYLASDGLGSAVVALNASGSVTASLLYAPYGGTRYSNGTMPTDYGFTGQRADATTGLDYYNARYYDQLAGQFASGDTVLPGDGYEVLGLSRYAYVEGNPVTRADPTGHIIRCEDSCGGSQDPTTGTGNNDVPEYIPPPEDSHLTVPPSLSPLHRSSSRQATPCMYGDDPGTCNTQLGYDLGYYSSLTPDQFQCSRDPACADSMSQGSLQLLFMVPGPEEFGLAKLMGLVGDRLGGFVGRLFGLGGGKAAAAAKSLGSTGRTVAESVEEQHAMEAAMANPAAGVRLPITMGDPRWAASAGWVKMAQNINGVEIHYVRNTITGAVDDFKFK